MFFQYLLLLVIEAQPEDSQFVQRSLRQKNLMELKTNLLFNFSNLLRVQLKFYDIFHRVPSILSDYKSFSGEIQAIFGPMSIFGPLFTPDNAGRASPVLPARSVRLRSDQINGNINDV
jgi:hypothetical protein